MRGIHESGHYATARALKRMYPAHLRGVRIRKITIVPEGSVGGYVNVKFTFPKGRLAKWLDETLPFEGKEPRVVHLFGGIASETIYNYLYGIHKIDEGIDDLGPGREEIQENAWVIMNHCGGTMDYDQIQELIGRDEEIWKPYFWKALGIVHRNWGAVLRLARALVDNTKMGAKEAHAVWSDPIPN